MHRYLVVAPVFATNCCVVADDDGDAVVIDAGAGVVAEVAKIVAEHGLRVRAILATHGHIDHTWDAAELSRKFDAPVRIHAADAYRLADPFGTLGGGDGAAVAAAIKQGVAACGLSTEYQTPENVVTFTDSGDDGAGNLVFGDFKLGLIHAPGHTEGSTLYLTGREPGRDDQVVYSGDVLFAGSIGRTDLPGANPGQMIESLAKLKRELDPAWPIIPGHGPSTTVARELATNPFLG